MTTELDSEMPLPKITVVTPCYNMGSYIENTIRSIINQGYDNLEYIIVDGGSTDNTLDIIDKYKNSITHFIHEKDNGMYDAIRKGFELSTGEILCWLNADDQSMPWTFQTVGEIFDQFPDINWLMGLPAFLNEKRQLTSIYSIPASIPQKYIRNGWCRSSVRGFLQQESMFWRKDLYVKAGKLNQEYRLAGDFELWMRFAMHSELATTNIPLSAFMKRHNSLSRVNDAYWDELKHILSDYKKYPSFIWKLGAKYPVARALLRLGTMYKTPLVYYSENSNRFELKRVRRPVSSNSLWEMYANSTLQ